MIAGFKQNFDTKSGVCFKFAQMSLGTPSLHQSSTNLSFTKT
jgi:hypothetical protein